MNLAALQQEFIGQILGEERPLPERWDARMRAGLEVYRNAYRARLVEALRESFEQTARWIGDESFRAAAAHYLIAEPPGGWTLDRVGEGFAETLAELFAGDPDVADLAWLEWAMHRAFTGADEPPLDPAGFARASSHFGDEDWAAMTLRVVATLQARRVATDCASLWRALKDGATPEVEAFADGHRVCLVWREAHSPVFRLVDRQEARCLRAMAAGATFGEICGELAETGDDAAAAAAAGEMLLGWLRLGLVVSVHSAAEPRAPAGFRLLSAPGTPMVQATNRSHPA